MWTEQITQAMALGAGIVPQTLNNGDAPSDAIDMQKSRRAMFILSLGAIVGGGVVNAYLQESSDNAAWPANGVASAFSGSGGTNVSLTALTAGSKIYTFEVKAEDLTAGKRYVRLQVHTTGGQNVAACVVCFGMEGVNKPDNKNNATSVTTQNVVA